MWPRKESRKEDEALTSPEELEEMLRPESDWGVSDGENRLRLGFWSVGWWDRGGGERGSLSG